jgi:hypothetical protein
MPTPINRKIAPHQLSSPVPFNPSLIGMPSVPKGDARPMTIDLTGDFGPIGDLEDGIEPGSTPLVEHISTPTDFSNTARKFGNHFKTGSKYAKGASTTTRFISDQNTSGRSSTASSSTNGPTNANHFERDASRPIAMLVIHQDESTVDVVEGSSLAASDSIYIDVVRIPDKGFG